MGSCCQKELSPQKVPLGSSNLEAVDKSAPKQNLQDVLTFQGVPLVSNGVYAIGRNKSGWFGLGHTKDVRDRFAILPINDLSAINKVLCGFYHSIFISTNGDVFVAGDNGMGQCALGVATKDADKTDAILIPRKINFFEENKYLDQNEKIAKVFVGGINSRCTWFITNKNRVFGCGKNEYGNLGIGTGDFVNRTEPVLIPYFDHLKPGSCINEIFASGYTSIALVSNPSKTVRKLIRCWTRVHVELNFPTDLVNLIDRYSEIGSEVHTTKSVEFTPIAANGLPNTSSTRAESRETAGKWTKVDFFDGKDIVKVAMAGCMTWWLESSGRVWTCGYDVNGFGTLGSSNINEGSAYTYTPVLVETLKGKKIIDIACGSSHCLAMDSKHNVYAWGWNGLGTPLIKSPRLIPDLPQGKIDKICCGETHSYCGCNDGSHYLFGSNENHECGVAPTSESPKYVDTPFCIDGTDSIQKVTLAHQATFVMLK